jgi:pimeloyl-ACP methyl ester carboxylesterase
MPAKFLRIGDEALHYLHAGPTTLPDVPPRLDRGRAIVFLSGEGGSASMWAGQLAHFGAEHSPVAVDLPGHGRSSGLDAPEGVPAAVAAVLAFLDGVAAPPAVLVGHGYGGHLALATALARPAAVRAVVAIGAAAAGAFPEEHAAKLRLVVKGRLGQQFDTPYFGSKPDMNAMRAFWTELAKTDPKVRQGDIDSYRASDLSGALGDVRVPVLVLHGAEDRICECAAGERLASAIPGARYEAIEGAGHVAHIERPDAVNRAIAGLLG